MRSRLLALMFLPQIALASKVQTAEDLVVQIKEEHSKIAVKEEARRNVLGELYTVNRELKKLNEDRSKLEKNLRKAGEDVSSLTQMIGQLDSRITQQRKGLRSRVKALSKMHGQGYVRILFGSQSSVDRLINLKVIKAITERDFRLIKAHKENISVFRAQKEKLNHQEQKLAVLKQNFDGKQKALLQKFEKKNTVLKSIDSERILHTAKLRRLRLETLKSSQANEELKKIRVIEELFAEQIFERKGDLAAPVDGATVLGYGWLPDAELGTKIRFKGHLIQAKTNALVKAVYRGEVVLVQEIDGYGLTVVVDHGSHYFSVYGNLGSADVRPGQTVAESQSLGVMGSRQAFFGEGLYFELRHFSDPENPQDWLKVARRK